jgi:hypothetical protein
VGAVNAGRPVPVRRAGAAVVLVVLGAQALINVARNLEPRMTSAQIVMSGAQIGYALVGLVAAIAIYRESALLRPAFRGWALLFILAVSLIPAAWVPTQMWLTGPMLLVALAVVSVLHKAVGQR